MQGQQGASEGERYQPLDRNHLRAERNAAYTADARHLSCALTSRARLSRGGAFGGYRCTKSWCMRHAAVGQLFRNCSLLLLPLHLFALSDAIHAGTQSQGVLVSASNSQPVKRQGETCTVVMCRAIKAYVTTSTMRSASNLPMHVPQGECFRPKGRDLSRNDRSFPIF
jgi:hypothetical protein